MSTNKDNKKIKIDEENKSKQLKKPRPLKRTNIKAVEQPIEKLSEEEQKAVKEIADKMPGNPKVAFAAKFDKDDAMISDYMLIKAFEGFRDAVRSRIGEIVYKKNISVSWIPVINENFKTGIFKQKDVLSILARRCFDVERISCNDGITGTIIDFHDLNIKKCVKKYKSTDKVPDAILIGNLIDQVAKGIIHEAIHNFTTDHLGIPSTDGHDLSEYGSMIKQSMDAKIEVATKIKKHIVEFFEADWIKTHDEQSKVTDAEKNSICDDILAEVLKNIDATKVYNFLKKDQEDVVSAMLFVEYTNVHRILAEKASLAEYIKRFLDCDGEK